MLLREVLTAVDCYVHIKFVMHEIHVGKLTIWYDSLIVTILSLAFMYSNI